MNIQVQATWHYLSSKWHWLIGVRTRFAKFIETHYLCVYLKDMFRCRWSQRHIEPCQPLWQASLCLSVWHGVGRGASEMPRLCVPHEINTSHRTYTAHIRTQDPPTASSILTYPYPTNPFVFIFPPLFLRVDVCVSACWLIGDALCAICNNPPHPSPPPRTLPTHHKGGLNHLCASVFPQWQKDDLGCGGAILVRLPRQKQE